MAPCILAAKTQTFKGSKTQRLKTQDGKTQNGKTQDGKTQDGKTQDGKTQDGKTGRRKTGRLKTGRLKDGKTGRREDSKIQRFKDEKTQRLNDQTRGKRVGQWFRRWLYGSRMLSDCCALKLKAGAYKYAARQGLSPKRPDDVLSIT
jgi:hypothetical protein